MFRKVIDIMSRLPVRNQAVNSLADIPSDCPLYEFIEGDRKLQRKPFRYIEKITLDNYSYLNDLFNENGYDFCTGEIGHLITNLMAYIGKGRGIPFIWPMISFWPDRFFLTSAYSRFSLSEAVFDMYGKVKGRELDETEINIAKGIIAKYRGTQMPVMSHMKPGTDKNDLPRKLKKFFDKANTFSGYLTGLIAEKENYYQETAEELFYRKVMTPFNRVRLKNKSPFEAPSQGEKNVLFFLHYEPDLSTLVWGTHFANQVEVIRNVAMSLPNGYRLYVREHPLCIGMRQRFFYERIKAIPAVKLVSSKVDRTGMIENTDLIVTITGTIGWEAIIRRKPVITLGNVFYNCFEGCTHVSDWNDLRGAIMRLIQDPRTPDDHDLMRFISAVYMCTKPGDYYSATKEEYDNIENSKRLADSFYEVMENFKQGQGLDN